MNAPNPLAESLRPLIESIVASTRQIDAEIADREAANHKGVDRLAFTESEAADLLGIPKHKLRDARINRHELQGSHVGKSVLYEKSELLRWLRARRCYRLGDLQKQMRDQK